VDQGSVGKVPSLLRLLSVYCCLPLLWQGVNRAEPAYVIDPRSYVFNTRNPEAFLIPIATTGTRQIGG